jgi:hypothetical protein
MVISENLSPSKKLFFFDKDSEKPKIEFKIQNIEDF